MSELYVGVDVTAVPARVTAYEIDDTGDVWSMPRRIGSLVEVKCDPGEVSAGTAYGITVAHLAEEALRFEDMVGQPARGIGVAVEGAVGDNGRIITAPALPHMVGRPLAQGLATFVSQTRPDDAPPLGVHVGEAASALALAEICALGERRWGHSGDFMVAVFCGMAALSGACVQVGEAGIGLRTARVTLSDPDTPCQDLAQQLVQFTHTQFGQSLQAGAAGRLILDGPRLEQCPELIDSCYGVIKDNDSATWLRGREVRLPDAGPYACSLGAVALVRFLERPQTALASIN